MSRDNIAGQGHTSYVYPCPVVERFECENNIDAGASVGVNYIESEK